MSWIKIKSTDELDPQQATLYRQLAGDTGQVDNVLQIHSLRPHTLIAHLTLYKAVLHHSHNELPVWLLECIGVYVSRLNRCDYCDRHHSEGLRLLIDDDAHFVRLDQALSQPLPGEPFSLAEQAVFRYVRKLTDSPSGLDQSDVADLRSAGYSDGEILEINQVASYFAYVNRSVLGLGVDVADEQLGTSPKKDEDLLNWAHQ